MNSGIQHWQTTLFGALAAGATALANYAGHGGWQGYVGAFAIAALGFFAKDGNK